MTSSQSRRAELATIYFTQIHIEEKLRRDQVSTEDEAIEVYRFVSDQVRKTLETLREPLPEDLPSVASIRKMVEERCKAAKQGNKKIQE